MKEETAANDRPWALFGFSSVLLASLFLAVPFALELRDERAEGSSKSAPYEALGEAETAEKTSSAS